MTLSHLPEISKALSSSAKLTPMMEQYVEIKKQYPYYFIFYRMGDFYELFFDDACEVSKLLNIGLTHRGKIGTYPIPMAGIPHHSASSYLDRLTTQGHKVVICEQLENPKEAKGLVKRGVVQIVGPGIPYDFDKIDTKSENYIAAAFYQQNEYFLTMASYTSGELFGLVTSDKELFFDKILLYAPKEFLYFKDQWKDIPEMQEILSLTTKTCLDKNYFNPDVSEKYLNTLIPSFQFDKTIKEKSTILAPLSAIAFYLGSTQFLKKFHHFSSFKLLNYQDSMGISQSTLLGLDIIPKSKELFSESLLGLMDRTMTQQGHREMRRQFISPLKERSKIETRLEVVGYLIEKQEILSKLRLFLQEIRDTSKILSKISTNKGRSQDLLQLAQSYEVFENIKKLFEGHPLLAELTSSPFEKLKSFSKDVLLTFNDELGASLDKGNLINFHIHDERDKLYKLFNNREDELKNLEEKYRLETKIGNLRIKQNNITGIFIEVSKSHTSKVPKHFTKLQSLVNGERFTTDELKKIEYQLAHAKEQLLAIEKEILTVYLNKALKISSLIMKFTQEVAYLDFIQSLSYISYLESFSRPLFCEEKKIIIKGGFHPLIRKKVKNKFTTHNLALQEDSFFALITGPNMAGKTTLMREVAIIQFLAQLGSFVPAEIAQLHTCDYIFARIGASDNILRGQSTFMVEMLETAEILRHATKDSLILLDEVGRGTSTYDGLALAWAIVEYMCKNIKSLTLFSTHYHELIELAENTSCAKNFTVKTSISNNDVQFHYELIEGHCEKSYGPYVAQLAGIPSEIVQQSRKMLLKLQKETPLKASNGLQHLPQRDFSHFEKIESELAAIDLNNMTPLEAMKFLQEMQHQIH